MIIFYIVLNTNLYRINTNGGILIMPRDERHTQTIPYGTLGIVPLASCSELGKKGK